MNFRNKEVILLVISLIVLQLIILLPKSTEVPIKFSPNLSCGTNCSEWQDVSCGISPCSNLEMFQNRSCSIVKNQNEKDINQGDTPQLSPFPVECTQRCVYTPNICNTPPSIPNLIFPLNNSINNSLDLTLSWSSSDINNQTLTYDLYFGESSNPPILISSLNSNFYNLEIENLDYLTTYYWKIISRDGIAISESLVYSFTTIDYIQINTTTNQTNQTNQTQTNNSITSPPGSEENVPPILTEEKNALFDIKLSISPEYLRLFPGEEVKADIILINFGDLKPVDAFLECSLLNEDNEQLNHFSETLAVETQVNLVRGFTLQEDIIKGQYSFSCTLTYQDQKVSSSYQFEVLNFSEEKPEEKARQDILPYVIGLITIYILINIFIKFKEKSNRRWKQRK